MYMVLLLAFYCTLANGVSEEPISFCIPANSTLAQTASCKCYSGGRGGKDGRSCGFSSDLVDLVCLEVSALDLPIDEVYRHVTCL